MTTLLRCFWHPWKYLKLYKSTTLLLLLLRFWHPKHLKLDSKFKNPTKKKKTSWIPLASSASPFKKIPVKTLLLPAKASLFLKPNQSRYDLSSYVHFLVQPLSRATTKSKKAKMLGYNNYTDCTSFQQKIETLIPRPTSMRALRRNVMEKNSCARGRG